MAILTQQDAKKSLAKLFLCYAQNGDESERQAKLQAYWDVLHTRNPLFVCEACEYAAKGNVGDGRFLPTAAELFRAAEAFSAREAQRNKHVPRLEPPVNDGTTRQRIIAAYAKLLADLTQGNPIDPYRATKEVFYPTNVCNSFDRHNRQRVERANPMDHSLA